MRLPHLKNRIGNVDNRCSQMLLIDIPTTSINQLIVHLSMIALANAFETGIGSQAIQTQQLAFL